MANKEKFSCPHCGLRYNVRPEWAGQDARCKCCKNVFTIPGTPPASVDPRIRALDQAGESHPLPEANVVGKTPPAPKVTSPAPKVTSPAPKVTSPAPKATAPEAKVIVDAEPVPFLEPIPEPAAVPNQEAYPTASPPSLAGEVPLTDFESLTAGTALGSLKPLQPQRSPSSNRSHSMGGQGIFSYFLSRPLACLLFLSTFITIYGICFSGISPYRWVDVGICFFVVYVGIRADRGEAINDLLIKVMMYFLVGSGVITSVAVGASFYSQKVGGQLAQTKSLLLVAIIASVVILGIFLVISVVAYLLCRLFGFFRTTASFYSFCNLAFFLLLIAGVNHRPSESSEATVADNRQEMRQPEFDHSPPPFNATPNMQQGEVYVGGVNDSPPQANPIPDFNPHSDMHHPPVTFPSATSREEAKEILFRIMQSDAFHEQMASNPGLMQKIHELLQRLTMAEDHEVAPIVAEVFKLVRSNDKLSEIVGINATDTNTNPFETPDSTPVNESPFGTVNSKPAEQNPFKTVDPTPTEQNPFKAVDPTPAEQNPFKAVDPTPAEQNPFKTVDPTPAEQNPFKAVDPTPVEQNPFKKVDSTPVEQNPFKTVDSTPAEQNPFKKVDSSPANENPFEDAGSNAQNDNPFEVPDTSASNENPFKASDSSSKPKNDEPKNNNVTKMSSVGAVSIDQILDRLNNGSTSGVKRVLKSLSRYQPIEEKREAVCRAMIVLLENDRLSFARREIVDILVNWMTPKVSEDLVKMMKVSDDYSSMELVKQLARVPDDKVAAAVVELWTKKPLFLKEAVIALGTRAEEPLWTVLKSSNQQLQTDACKFLAQQGTQKSIIKLAELAYGKGNKDRSVAEAAENAMKVLTEKKGE